MMFSQQLDRRIGHVSVWGKPLAFFAAVGYFLLSLLFDCALQNNWSPLWIPIGIVTYAQSVLLVWLALTLGLRKYLAKKNRAWPNVLIAGLVNAAHNLSVGVLAAHFDLFTEDPLWVFRAFGGFLGGVLLILIYALSFGARVEHSVLMAELIHTNRSLTELRAGARGRLEQQRNQIAQATRGALLPRLAQLQQLISDRNSRLDSINTLQRIIEDEVRPISQVLNSRVFNSLDAMPAVEPIKLKRLYLGTNLPLKRLIRPIGSALLMVLINWSFAYMVIGDSQAILVSLVTITQFGMLFLIRSICPKALQLGRFASSTVLYLIGFATSLVPYFFAVSLENAAGDWALLGAIPAFGGLVMLITAESQVVESVREEARAKLAQTNETIRHELTLFAQRVWLAKRSWQFVVHGSVQAALTAALVRLRDSKLSDAVAVMQVRDDIDRAIASLANVEKRAVDLPQALRDIRVTWSGVCEVSFIVDRQVELALVGNPEASACVNEILKEVVQNAVRHGGANSVDCSLTLDAPDTLRVVAINDGVVAETEKNPPATGGVGSGLLDELTLDWSLDTDPDSGLTRFVATVPIS